MNNSDGVSLWRRAMNCALAGIALSLVTFNLLGLNYILPVAGHILCLVGFRALCRENKYFKGSGLLQ